MAGIYIHVPFCYTRCAYCDFYKTTDQQFKDEYIKAVCKEIDLKATFFQTEEIKTIYFGGGTPSTLTPFELSQILNHLYKFLSQANIEELTLEVNPDDITLDYVMALVKLGVNRISMGVQSFFDSHLRQMNRRHNAVQARDAIDTVQGAGIDNMSIDLIYGLPYMSFEEWKENVRLAIESKVQHISAYHLTFEKGTLYYDYLKKGTLKEVPEVSSVEQFEYLVEQLSQAGYENYEISNFALPGLYSRHNSSYWTGEKYMGFGPSAHSYDGEKRLWNISHLKKYCQALDNDLPYYEAEILSNTDRFNELIMLGLRTTKGFQLKAVETLLSKPLKGHFDKELAKQLASDNVEIQDGFCTVKANKRLITDRIISDFFYLENF